MKKMDDESGLNLIVQSTTIEGTLKTNSSIRIDGKLIGTIVCGGSFVLGATGIIEGDVVAEDAIIGGNVNGTLKINKKLTLETKSSVQGEIQCGSLIIEDGAAFDGKSNMKNHVKSDKPDESSQQES